MSVESGRAASPPDWAVLSEELQALLTSEGPLTYGALMTRYKAVTGRELNLHGHGLVGSLTNRHLKGLRFNFAKLTLELDRERSETDAPEALTPTSPDSTPCELLAQELHALVSIEGRLRTSDVAERYKAMHGKQLVLHGRRLRDRLRDGILPGLLYSKERGTVELADAPTPPEKNLFADELRLLVATKWPLQLKDVASSYLSLFHKPFGGSKLKVRLNRGDLRGVRYNKSSAKMELDDTLSSDATAPAVLPVPQPAVHAEASAGAAHAAAPPAVVVITGPAPASSGKMELDDTLSSEATGPAPLPAPQPAVHAKASAGAAHAVAPPAAIVIANPAPATATATAKAAATAAATQRPATKPAVPPNAGASVAANGKELPAATFQRPAPAKQQRVSPAGRASGVGMVVPRPSSSSASRVRSSSSSPSGGTKLPYLLIDSPASCMAALATMPHAAAQGPTLQGVCTGSVVVVQLDGRQLGSEARFISLIKLQVIGPLTPKAIIYDVVKLEGTRAGQRLLCNQLCALLADQSTTKVVHDFNNSAIALRRHFGAECAIHQILDLELAFEAVHGRISADAISVMRAFGQGSSYSDAASRAFTLDEAATARRPLDTSTLGGAAMAVMSLAKVTEHALSKLSETQQEGIVLHASQMAVEFAMSTMLRGMKRASFRDHGSCWGGGTGRVLTTYELKQAREISARGTAGPSAPAAPLPLMAGASSIDGGNLTALIDNTKPGDTTTVNEDPNSPVEVLRLVPEEFLLEHLTERHTQNLKDVIELVIDEGRRPYATLQERGKLYLCDDETVVVTKAHVDKVVGRLDSEGRFGHDNRAGVPGQLHRVSVMRSREAGRIYGVTLRIGRYFPGSASVIDDLLFHVQDGPDKPERAASILILGKPGSGKTTVLRDICRKVSQEQTVVIVDTSNEIAGDGDIPHLQAIGQSRRMMVPNKEGQHSVMKEALQNHTPQTIVVDEVSNKLEARACLDIKARGVRMVASAHGDFQSLLKNPELNSLVGGSTTVTLGDQLAKATNGGNKVQAQRAGSPIFDVIVEVERGEVCSWTIVRNVDLAVDAILDRRPYQVEKRTCIPQEEPDLLLESADPKDVTFLLECVDEVEKTRQHY